MTYSALAVIVNLTIQNTIQQHNGRNHTLALKGVFITEGRQAVYTCEGKLHAMGLRRTASYLVPLRSL
jgi:hypothetical protein